MSAKWRRSIKLTAADDVATDTCLYVPPAALRNTDLPRRLIVQGPDGASKLVGATRIDGGDDEYVIRVSPTLLGTLAPGRESVLTVGATVRPASWRDVRAHMEREDRIKIVAALVALCAAAITAIAAIVTLELSVGIVAGALTIMFLAAAFTARREIREAMTPKCR